MKKLYYSEKVISSIKELAEALSNATDKELVNEKIRFYADYRPHMERLKTVLSLASDSAENILEIGSGIGTNCLLAKAFTGANIVGVEPAFESYSLLLKCISDFQEANPHLPYEAINCGGENILYPDESFDFIYSFEVLEHVQNPEQVLKEIYRLLKPGACAYISTCNYDSFYEGHYKRFWNPFISPEANGKRYECQGLAKQFLTELNFITKKNIKKMSEKIGFKDLIFNPNISMLEENSTCMIEAVYPEEFEMPAGAHVEPTWWHKTIESPKVANLLAKFDRDYKLYILFRK